MSSEQPRRGRDTIGAGSAGSPMGSTAAIIIAVVAVVAGFLILRQIRSDDGGDASVPATVATVPLDSSTGATTATVATTPAPTQPTVFVPTVDGATVVVANASTVDGAAGRLTTSLQGQGFTTAEATNSTAKQDDTTILYDPTNTNALAVAQSLGVLINVSIIQEMPSPPPVNGGVLPDGASVVVMLGSDKATLTLEQMGTPTTVAGTPTSLPPVGGVTATSAP